MTTPQEDAELREQTRRSIARLISIQRGDDTWNEDDYTTAGNILIVCTRLIKARDEQREKGIEKVTRFEVIDHRECLWCRGRKTANYLQKYGSYKEQPCDKCDGSGMMGGRVYAVSSNAERSIIQVALNYQDDGRTLKVFVNDREQDKEEE